MEGQLGAISRFIYNVRTGKMISTQSIKMLRAYQQGWCLFIQEFHLKNLNFLFSIFIFMGQEHFAQLLYRIHIFQAWFLHQMQYDLCFMLGGRGSITKCLWQTYIFFRSPYNFKSIILYESSTIQTKGAFASLSEDLQSHLELNQTPLFSAFALQFSSIRNSTTKPK